MSEPLPPSYQEVIDAKVRAITQKYQAEVQQYQQQYQQQLQYQYQQQLLEQQRQYEQQQLQYQQLLEQQRKYQEYIQYQITEQQRMAAIYYLLQQQQQQQQISCPISSEIIRRNNQPLQSQQPPQQPQQPQQPPQPQQQSQLQPDPVVTQEIQRINSDPQVGLNELMSYTDLPNKPLHLLIELLKIGKYNIDTDSIYKSKISNGGTIDSEFILYDPNDKFDDVSVELYFSNYPDTPESRPIKGYQPTNESKQKCSFKLANDLLKKAVKDYLKIENDFTKKDNFSISNTPSLKSKTKARTKQRNETDPLHNIRTQNNLMRFLSQLPITNNNNLFIDGMNILYSLGRDFADVVLTKEQKQANLTGLPLLISFINNLEGKGRFKFDNYVIFLQYHVFLEYMKQEDSFFEERLSTTYSGNVLILYEYKATRDSKPYYFILLPEITPEKAYNGSDCPKTASGNKIVETDDYLLTFFWLKYGGFILSFDNYRWFGGANIKIKKTDREYGGGKFEYDSHFLTKAVLDKFKIFPTNVLSNNHSSILSLIKSEILALHHLKNKKDCASSSFAGGGYKTKKKINKNKIHKFTKNNKQKK